MITLKCDAIPRPLHSPFRIARGAKTEAHTLVVTLYLDGKTGRGEAVPYARYGETMESEIAKLEALDAIQLEDDPRDYLDAGAARNALDCALWDLRAKSAGTSVAELLDLPGPIAVKTAQTLSLDTPEKMALAAQNLRDDALIKVKLGGEGDIARLEAVQRARPNARLIVDANEGWTHADYERYIPQLQALKIEMIEQPFPAANDDILASLERPIPICADESAHVAADVERLANRYDMINIKLDKTGGLSEALDMLRAAQARQMPYMIGCMVGSSLGMAPAYLLSKNAAYVDLDGPLFLREDEQPCIQYREGIMQKPPRQLWG